MHDNARKIYNVDVKSISTPVFAGKTCVVTGGSTGMGFSIAVEMAQQGAAVVYCLARTKAFWDASMKSAKAGTVDADRTPLYMGQVGIPQATLNKIKFIQCDMRVPKQCKAAFALIGSALGTQAPGSQQIDVLCLNSSPYKTFPQKWSAVEWPKSLNMLDANGDLNRTIVDGKPVMNRHRWPAADGSQGSEDVHQSVVNGVRNGFDAALPLLAPNALIEITSSVLSTYNISPQPLLSDYITAKAAVRQMASMLIPPELEQQYPNLSSAKVLTLCPDVVGSDLSLPFFFYDSNAPPPANGILQYPSNTSFEAFATEVGYEHIYDERAATALIAALAADGIRRTQHTELVMSTTNGFLKKLDSLTAEQNTLSVLYDENNAALALRKAGTDPNAFLPTNLETMIYAAVGFSTPAMTASQKTAYIVSAYMNELNTKPDTTPTYLVFDYTNPNATLYVGPAKPNGVGTLPVHKLDPALIVALNNVMTGTKLEGTEAQTFLRQGLVKQGLEERYG